MKVEFNWRDYDDYTKWLQDVLTTLYEENQELRDEKVKLLSENQQLKKQKDDVVEYIKSNCIVSDEWTELDFCNFVPTGKISYKALNKEKVKDLLRMLGEIE